MFILELWNRKKVELFLYFVFILLFLYFARNNARHWLTSWLQISGLKTRSTISTPSNNISIHKHYSFFKFYKHVLIFVISGLQQFFACSKCGCRYRQKSSVYRHEKYECGVEPQFSCTMCSKRFHQQSNLRQHIICKHSEHW